jgi:hypothetical protein
MLLKFLRIGKDHTNTHGAKFIKDFPRLAVSRRDLDSNTVGNVYAYIRMVVVHFRFRGRAVQRYPATRLIADYTSKLLMGYS